MENLTCSPPCPTSFLLFCLSCLFTFFVPITYFVQHSSLPPLSLSESFNTQIARRSGGSREPTQSGWIPFQLWSSGKHRLLPVPDRGWQQLLRPEEEESLPNVHGQQTQEFLFFSTPVLWRLVPLLVHKRQRFCLPPGVLWRLEFLLGYLRSSRNQGKAHKACLYILIGGTPPCCLWSVLWSYIVFESWWIGAVLQRTVCMTVCM